MDSRTEFVAIFDADAMPFPDVLNDLLYHFYSNGNEGPRPLPQVGAVQSYQWHVLNKSESWLTAAVRTELEGLTIADPGACTACSDLYFSWRARKDTARFATIAWMS